MNTFLFSILLLAMASNAVFLTECRQLKTEREKNNTTFSMAKESGFFPPATQEKELDFDTSDETNDFRPTDPGNSPGIGHHSRKGGLKNSEKATGGNASHGDTYFTSGSADGFRPTTPGHSPGVGHSLVNKLTGP
ncbi:hypothetical protein Leryth_008235 [Lithospermum erythrorhizon]|nr:hypothetical protein Leryth_008235 [Lithospermum erythrorhizon]